MIQPVGGYNPPEVREAFLVCRLANAELASKSLNMRYSVSEPANDFVSPENIRIRDFATGRLITVPELLSRLSEDNRKRVPFML
jgi:hypothetical protein